MCDTTPPAERPALGDVRYPPGTPEYAQYRAELQTELGKFARGEDPYPYQPAERPACLKEDETRREPTGADGPHPCSYPGCGKPTAYLPHADNGQGKGWGEGWRHVDPADETSTHVGYPMPRGGDAE